jgi:hypothetical protein
MPHMDPIEERIICLQTRNFESSSFVPTSELEQLLTEEVVRTTVHQSAIDVSKQEETVRIVVSGARAIFAILVLQSKLHFIRNFIEQDQYQNGQLDAKLPYSELALQNLLGKAAGRLFWDRQWMFIAPIFRHDLSHRILKDAVVLPFIQSSYIGEGAFGVVSEVTLHPQHQGFEEVKSEVCPRLL